jgi:hypothetical protein
VGDNGNIFQTTTITMFYYNIITINCLDEVAGCFKIS